ncbi:MAG TPA: dockerin type I repeat-containing protein, partial [Bryobacteraceae bacterium]|nr:dockerin type I repeat-containing protein [Bryobacteraceae bacterium]
FTDNGGVPETFTIRAAGNPAPAISLGSDFLIPHGYTFHDNGDGTATISGTDPGNAIYIKGQITTYVIGGTVLASNLLGNTSQQLAITFAPAPTPVVTGSTTATFTPGIGNSFTISTTGATTGVTMKNTDPLPSWMTFKDNGNGTATYSGIPPLTATSFDVTTGILPQAAGQNGIFVPSLITIHVSAVPVFTDIGTQLITVCQVNQPCVLNVHTNMTAGTLSLSGDRPVGLNLAVSSPEQGELDFQTATGGAYPVTVNAANGVASTNQVYTFYVQQAPGFPLAISHGQGGFSNFWDTGDIWFMANVPVSFPIATTGYPHDVGVTTPGGTVLLPPMQLTITRLPQGLSFASQTSAGIPTGTGLISGTPADGAGSTGDWGVGMTANNGLESHLTLHIHVRHPGDVNEDFQVDCTDVNTIKAAMGSHPGQANYNAQADINNDGVVNVIDLALVARYLPRTCPLQ